MSRPLQIRKDSMSAYHQRLFADEGRPRVIVCGSRTIKDKEFVFAKLDILTKNLTNPIIITGAAEGVDKLAEDWAFSRGLHNHRFHAEWDKHGKAAGPMRNRDMAIHAAERDPAYCIAIWDGKSAGTENMIDTARKFKLKLRVIEYKKRK